MDSNGERRLCSSDMSVLDIFAAIDTGKPHANDEQPRVTVSRGEINTLKTAKHYGYGSILLSLDSE